MKLGNISRRDFLKSAASATVNANKINKLLSAVTQVTAASAGRFAREIALFKQSGLTPSEAMSAIYSLSKGAGRVVGNDYGYNLRMTSFGMLDNEGEKLINSDVLTGALADHIAEDPMLLLGIIQDRSYVNSQTNAPLSIGRFKNLLSVFCNDLHNQLGTNEFIRFLLSYGMHSPDLSNDEISSLSNDDINGLGVAAELVPSLKKIINVGGNKDIARVASVLRNRGIISNQEAKNIITHEYKLKEGVRAGVEKQKKEQEAKLEREKQERDKDAEVGRVKTPPDYELAEPMHQPFESRLRRALAII